VSATSASNSKRLTLANSAPPLAVQRSWYLVDEGVVAGRRQPLSAHGVVTAVMQ
jgi:hypothetical protein